MKDLKKLTDIWDQTGFGVVLSFAIERSLDVFVDLYFDFLVNQVLFSSIKQF